MFSSVSCRVVKCFKSLFLTCCMSGPVLYVQEAFQTQMVWSNRQSVSKDKKEVRVLRSLFSLANLTLNLCCTSGPGNTHR